MGRDGWQIAIETETALTADGNAFHVTGTMRVTENGDCVHQRRWDEHVPRDNM